MAPFEEEIVSDIVLLMWRKINLINCQKYSQDLREIQHPGQLLSEYERPSEAGDLLEGYQSLVRVANSMVTSTLESVEERLRVEERLDTMINRKLKMLLLVRGTKSLNHALEKSDLRPSQPDGASTRTWNPKKSPRRAN